MAWCALFPKPALAPPVVSSRPSFLAAYGTYMADEYPNRGTSFWSMVAALRPYLNETSMPQADLFKYLGQPNQYFLTNVVVSSPGNATMTNEVVMFAYLFERPGDTTNWAATAVLENGKVRDIRLGDAAENQVVPFARYPQNGAPNQQGGANGKQPFSSETDPSAAAAASRPSP